ncbi:MAG: hypothetical protein KBG48_20305 [Kofleriaceae bacterium]|nr:hypothetical protein [Kofleriaceae bacterium]MBP9169757.1 hypothetical protein [Kofleriaceae bacterium]MBP9862153.1 hypothetical protein [Kofleriaceae bacterium]
MVDVGAPLSGGFAPESKRQRSVAVGQHSTGAVFGERIVGSEDRRDERVGRTPRWIGPHRTEQEWSEESGEQVSRIVVADGAVRIP